MWKYSKYPAIEICLTDLNLTLKLEAIYSFILKSLAVFLKPYM